MDQLNGNIGGLQWIIGLVSWILILLLALFLKDRLPPRRPGKLFEGLLIFAVVFLAYHLLVTSVLQAFKSDDGTRTALEFPSNLYLMAVSLGVICSAAVGLVARIRGKEGLGAMGFNLRKPWISFSFTLVLYIAFLPLYTLICYLVNRLIMTYEPQKLVERMLENPEFLSSIPVIVCAALIIPVFEEVMFRGFLLSGLRAFMGDGLSVILSAGIFGCLHEPQAMIPVFFLGCLLGYLKVRTGSLYTAMLLHGMHNSLMLLCVPLMKGSP
jgi:membrane protease YdiL (CAAX protease family)